MNTACPHIRAYSYLDQEDSERTFLVRWCYDCNAEIVRYRMTEDGFKHEEKQKAFETELLGGLLT